MSRDSQITVTLPMVRTMWGALLAGALIFPLVMAFLSWNGTLPPVLPELSQQVIIGAVVLAVAARVAGSWLYQRILLGADQKADALRTLQSATIVGMAVCEFACMFVGVSVLLTGKPLVLVALLSPLSGMLRMQPGQGTLDALRGAAAEDSDQPQELPR